MLKRNWPFIVLLIGVVAYTLWSFTQVEPNLVLSNQTWFWTIQQEAWKIGFHNRTLASILFVVIMSLLTLGYVGVLVNSKKGFMEPRNSWRWWIVLVAILLFSYPSLSHDIFNYLFNAKMLWKYQENPHVQVALNFPQDPWLKYMHNIHTPAPYAYGWTAISLIPSLVAGEQIKTAIIVFRFFIVGWLLITLYSLLKIAPGKQAWVLALAFHPLILIETISSIHNDIVMMGFVTLALVALQKGLRSDRLEWKLLALFLFMASVSIKYASIVLVSVGFLYWLRKKVRIITTISWGGWAALAMTLTLLSPQSKFFLAWYAIWPLVFLPLIKERQLRWFVILLGITALLSYVPYLYVGYYSAEVLHLRTIIIFVPVLSFAATNLVLKLVAKKSVTYA